jgi:hypothetical protein
MLSWLMKLQRAAPRDAMATQWREESRNYVLELGPQSP